MRLATPEGVLAILGIQSGPGTLASAGAALDAVVPLIESALDTTLARTSRTDYFTLARTETRDPVLRLSCSFIDKQEPVIVKYLGLALTPDFYTMDYEKGLVHLHGTYQPVPQALDVYFTAGFEAANPALPPATLPSPITQAALSWAAAYLLTNPANNARDKGRFMAATGAARYMSAAKVSLYRYDRPRACVVWPLMTDILS